MRFPPSRYCDIYFLEDHYKQKCCHFERAGGGIARSGRGEILYALHSDEPVVMQSVQDFSFAPSL
jgi:hypothetical protein